MAKTSGGQIPSEINGGDFGESVESEGYLEGVEGGDVLAELVGGEEEDRGGVVDGEGSSMVVNGLVGEAGGG